MLQTEYLDAVRDLTTRLETAAAAQADAAAGAIAESLVAGNAFFIGPLGHGNDGDLLHRAGGLIAAQPFSVSFSRRDSVGGATRDRPRPEPYDDGLELARVAVRGSRMRRGDCLVTGSVSGRSVAPISLAIAAGEMGIRVIGITSAAYSSRIAPIHSSGKRLSEVCEFVIDNCVPFGDAAMQVEGLSQSIIPLSGVATIMACWMICAQVTEKLLARGLTPSHYISANRPDGPEFNKRMQEQFSRQGY